MIIQSFCYCFSLRADVGYNEYTVTGLSSCHQAQTGNYNFYAPILSGDFNVGGSIQESVCV